MLGHNGIPILTCTASPKLQRKVLFVYINPWWNPIVENQAIDRAHRMGQLRSVNVYRLITEGTIEEKIQALQKKKKNLFDALIGECADLFTKLTWDDVKALVQ